MFYIFVTQVTILTLFPVHGAAASGEGGGQVGRGAGSLGEMGPGLGNGLAGGKAKLVT